jgi:predicted DNA-binding transcriptional regulator YafY
VVLDVTERAARRYVAILREAGIPVEAKRGPYGGYRLGGGIRLPPLVFSAAEALALVMAVLDASHAATDADDPVDAALSKIIRALPESAGRPAPHAAPTRACRARPRQRPPPSRYEECTRRPPQTIYRDRPRNPGLQPHNVSALTATHEASV